MIAKNDFGYHVFKVENWASGETVILETHLQCLQLLGRDHWLTRNFHVRVKVAKTRMVWFRTSCRQFVAGDMYLAIRYAAHDTKLVLRPNPFIDRLEDNEMTYNAIEAHYHNVLTSNALVRVTMEHQVPVNRVYFVTGTVV